LFDVLLKETNMPKLRRIAWCVALIAAVGNLWSTGYAAEREPDVRFVPTPQDVVMEMLRMARVAKDDVVYDLGCGDGRIVITAAKAFGARGMGVDIDPVRIRESNENAIKAGVSDRVKFIQQDLFESAGEATVVSLYLPTELRLRPKLFRELRPGTASCLMNLTWTTETRHRTVPKMKVYYQPKSDHKGFELLLESSCHVAGDWEWTVRIREDNFSASDSGISGDQWARKRGDGGPR
jgi:SAM-dependent methyltransferase